MANDADRRVFKLLGDIGSRASYIEDDAIIGRNQSKKELAGRLDGMRARGEAMMAAIEQAIRLNGERE